MKSKEDILKRARNESWEYDDVDERTDYLASAAGYYALMLLLTMAIIGMHLQLFFTDHSYINPRFLEIFLFTGFLAHAIMLYFTKKERKYIFCSVVIVFVIIIEMILLIVKY